MGTPSQFPTNAELYSSASTAKYSPKSPKVFFCDLVLETFFPVARRMDLDAFIEDFGTDITIKEEQLEELLSQTKEMVDIVDVLEQVGRSGR